MIRFILAVTFCFAVSFAFAQTQTGMNEDALKSYQNADKELNTVYQSILKEYRKDSLFIKNFRYAQKTWIQFRDAEIRAKYPDGESGDVGSARPLCWYNYLTELTDERTKKIKVWLTGIAEGDVCTGSVKTKN